MLEAGDGSIAKKQICGTWMNWSNGWVVDRCKPGARGGEIKAAGEWSLFRTLGAVPCYSQTNTVCGC